MDTGNKIKRRAKSKGTPPIPPLNKGGQGGGTAIFYITDNGFALAERLKGFILLHRFLSLNLILSLNFGASTKVSSSSWHQALLFGLSRR